MTYLHDHVIKHLQSVAGQPDLDGTPYRMIRKIGEGGMGSVYLVADRLLGRQVALKVTKNSGTTDDLTERMLAEARVVAGLEHPGIVPLYDAGRLADGRMFYTMKHVEGHRLKDRQKAAGTLPEKLRLFQKICEAVAFAHDRGIVHRDLKPENIMIGSFGSVMVMDWGIARTEALTDEVSHVDSAGASRTGAGTKAGAVLGTPGYMAPEQSAGKPELISPATDVFGLGGVLFFLLTGEAPVNETTKAGVPQIIRPPRKLVTGIPKPVDAVCMKALGSDPAARYPNAGYLAADVARYLNGQPVTAYRENIFERLGRWYNLYRFVILLVVTYLIARILIYLFSLL